LRSCAGGSARGWSWNVWRGASAIAYPLYRSVGIYSTVEKKNGEDGYGDLLELPRFGDAPLLIRDGPGARLLDDAVGFHKQNITLLLVYLGWAGRLGVKNV
jgi:hypothetical protein